MRVYLDNCCYNRPTQLKVRLEPEAKMEIQTLMRVGARRICTLAKASMMSRNGLALLPLAISR